jgi:hypothetical protein
MRKRFALIFLSVMVSLMVSLTAEVPAWASPDPLYELFQGQTVGCVKTNYVRIDMNNPSIRPLQVSANGSLTSTAAVADMAVAAGAFAAVNGTYFEAYNGVPVPWGTLIRDGKLLHISNGGAVVGFTDSGRLLIDRLRFDFLVYVNGSERAIPWRINHPSDESDAITLFTPEYGAAVSMPSGARAVLISTGAVTEITSGDFWTPGDGFAVVYGSNVASMADQRFKPGDRAYYAGKIRTTFTDTKDWDSVKTAVGAGPSLIINGQVTADGAAEGFTEAKINTTRASRSFIGATEGGQVVAGNMAAATLSEAAAACQELGLINAMCLDGGGSVALSVNGQAISAGRDVNNALVFVSDEASADVPAAEPPAAETLSALGNRQKLSVDGTEVTVQAYNINDSNYFKLRDVAHILSGTPKQFAVGWDDAANAITLTSGAPYTAPGGETAAAADTEALTPAPTASKIILNGEEISFTAYNIKGSNYFKLRDIGQAFDFEIGWDGAQNTIVINTAKG